MGNTPTSRHPQSTSSGASSSAATPASPAAKGADDKKAKLGLRVDPSAPVESEQPKQAADTDNSGGGKERPPLERSQSEPTTYVYLCSRCGAHYKNKRNHYFWCLRPNQVNNAVVNISRSLYRENEKRKVKPPTPQPKSMPSLYSARYHTSTPVNKRLGSLHLDVKKNKDVD